MTSAKRRVDGINVKGSTQKNGQTEEQNSTSWLTTFNDLVTLLMVFFVLLFSLGSIDTKKMADFQYALQSGLGVLKEGTKISVAVQETLPVRDMHNINTQPEGRDDIDGRQSIQQKITTALQALDVDIGIRVTHTDRGAYLSFADGVLFDFGQAAIRTQGYAILDKIAEVIRKLPYSIRVEGHTDNVPIRTKRFPSNWELSTARAVSVLKYFAQTGGIAPRRLSAVGYGESKPLVANDSPQHRAKNRRVEIVLVKEEIK
jgi:chemotaxis protein MotB